MIARAGLIDGEHFGLGHIGAEDQWRTGNAPARHAKHLFIFGEPSGAGELNDAKG